jgi:hypothetical protein
MKLALYPLAALGAVVALALIAEVPAFVAVWRTR